LTPKFISAFVVPIAAGSLPGLKEFVILSDLSSVASAKEEAKNLNHNRKSKIKKSPHVIE